MRVTLSTELLVIALTLKKKKGPFNRVVLGYCLNRVQIDAFLRKNSNPC